MKSKRMRKRILLYVDHRNRDLAGLVLLKCVLERKYNYEVLVARYGLGYTYFIDGFSPHLISVPNVANDYASEFTRQAKNAGSLVALIRSEGLAFNEKKLSLFAGVSQNLSNIDLNFTWGHAVRDAIAKYNTFSLERTFVCGNPRFDLYAPPWAKILKSKDSFCKENDLDIRRPIITWATNYVFASIPKGKFDEEMTFNRLEVFNADNVREKQIISRQHSIKIFFEIVQEVPNVNFVLKPHPYEDVGFYRSEASKMKVDNFVLMSREVIENILNSTDILLTYDSTTAAEAWFLKKPTLALDFIKEGASDFHELLSGSEKVRTKRECIRMINYYLNNGRIPYAIEKNRDAFIRKWFLKIDGKSAERHADVIHRHLRKSRRTSKSIHSLTNIVKYMKWEALKYLPNERLKFWRTSPEDPRCISYKDTRSLVMRISRVARYNNE